MCYSGCIFENRLGSCKIDGRIANKLEEELGFRRPCPSPENTEEERNEIIKEVYKIMYN